MTTQMDKDSIDFVLDKGTYDALCSDTKKATKELVKKYLQGIEHVLNTNGSFLLVSLLQDFVLEELLNFYIPSSEGAIASKALKGEPNYCVQVQMIKGSYREKTNFIPFFVQISKSE
jgi:hypothetical protein